MRINFKEKVNRKEFIERLSLLGLVVGASPFLMALIKQFKAYGFERTKEAYYYNKLADKKVECTRCPVRCILGNKQKSFCRTRTNINGTLYEDSYNNPCVINIDPIEKSPLYHVLPGIKAFAFGTAGCNLRCLYCQNWQVSMEEPAKVKNIQMTPKELVDKTFEKKLQAVTFTYTEPVVFFDYIMDIADIAKRNALLTQCCTAAYINPQPLKDMCKKIDVFTVTLKGFSEKFYNKVCGQSLKPVLESLKILKEEGKWFEIVHLIVPTLNDDYNDIKDMSKWIYSNLGPNVPVHFTRFFPAYKLQNLQQTPQRTLEDARKIGQDAGLNYVYIDNLPGHEGNNTYCHNCRKELIQRSGITVLKSFIKDGRCKYCKVTVPGLWKV